MDTGNPITTDETDEFGIDHTSLGGAWRRVGCGRKRPALLSSITTITRSCWGGSVAKQRSALAALVLSAERIYTRYDIGPKCREWSQGEGRGARDESPALPGPHWYRSSARGV